MTPLRLGVHPPAAEPLPSLESYDVMIKKNLLRPSVLVLAGALLSLGLAGCDEKKPATAQTDNAPALPLTTGPATASVPAPAASALPAAPPVKVVHVANPSDRYAYVDRAYEMSNAIGQAPPDYGFDYQGVHPWVWRGSNREMRLIEPVDGGDRYYYYRPGAETPYLVRDPDYSYGFSDGQLVVVYDNEGRMLPPDYIDRRADDAGRYLARATALYQASLRSERRSVNAANWAARRAALDAARARWEAQQNQQDDWRAYHARHDTEDRTYWQGERDQRERAARSVNDWQNQGYNGPPPPPVRYEGHEDRNGQSNSGPGFRHDDASRDSRDGGQSQPPMRNDRDPAQQARDDAAHQAKAVADAAAQARQQQAQADAAQQARVNAEAARQAKAAADASARAQLQRTQADAMRVQQKARDDAAQQARTNADAMRRTQADAARAQQKAQADAAQQAQQRAATAQQAKAAADAQAQQRAQGDAARAQQKAQADAAAKAKANAAHAAAPPQPQILPGTVPLTKEQADAKRAADRKAREDARHHHDGDGNPPAQQ